MRPVKILIELRDCTGWSESSWCRYVFWSCGVFKFALNLVLDLRLLVYNQVTNNWDSQLGRVPQLGLFPQLGRSHNRAYNSNPFHKRTDLR